MKIFSKLLIVLSLMTGFLFVSLYLLMQWSIDRGMVNYINQRETANLQLLTDNLTVVYKTFNGWQELANSPRLWHQIIRQSAEGETLTESLLEDLVNQPLPPPSGLRGRQGPRANEQERPLRRPEETNNRGLSADNRNLNPRPLTDEIQEAFPSSRLPSLLNADKKVIFGEYSPQYSMQEITFKNNVIGYIALLPKKSLTDSYDLAFVQRQQSTWLYILLVTFVITFAITIFLSRYLVRNVQRITQATTQLNRGHYQIKLLVRGNDELARLARNVNELAITLAQNEYSRRQWLADTSHELRTPLAIIKGEIEAMQDGIRPLNLDNLQSIADEIVHLQKLITDLNQLSNADLGGLSYQKEEINFAALLKQNISRREQDFKKANLSISTSTTELNSMVWGDQTRLNQLLDNLFTNTIKYTDDPGIINVSLDRFKNKLILRIEDSPPSVTDASLSKLFDYLYREETSRNRKTGGSGLGLALCKKIVLAHQGEIKAYHSNLGGLGIKIILPTT